MHPTALPDQPPEDVSGPTPSPNEPTHSPPPDLSGNIAVKAQNAIPSSAPPSNPPAADDDLDKIMQDVGHQLKKEDEKPSKKHRSFFGRRLKNQPAAKLHAQPLPAAPQARAPQPATPPKPPKTSSAPVTVIVVTIIVAGILIAAAIATYKK